MTKYVLAYHGGGMPETPEEQQEVMARWGAWMGALGDKLVDGGNPIAQARTIASDGSVTDGGPADPLTGYSLLEAASLDEAVTLAKDCPILDNGGRIEVAETMEM